jgi:DNA-binding response OmpR family regulator
MEANRIPAESAITVLVVSPDELDHRSLRRILRADCRLYRSIGRHDAISVVRRHRPRVVICDQVLADGNWRDLLTDLQRQDEMPALIVSSRLADDRLWAEVLNLGAYDLLMKPFAAAEVSRVVNMAARRTMTAGGG